MQIFVQSVHAVAPVVELYFPVGQVVHVVATVSVALLKVPAAQLAHTDVGEDTVHAVVIAVASPTANRWRIRHNTDMAIPR